MFLAEVVGGVQVFEVFRMIQYKDLETNTFFGSQRANLNLIATTLSSSSLLTRKVVLLPLGELNGERLREMGKKGAEGLVLILPSPSSFNSTLYKDWPSFEKQLIFKKLPIPLFFAHETENLKKLYMEMKSGYSDNLQFIVSGPSEAPVINSFPISNIHVSFYLPFFCSGEK